MSDEDDDEVTDYPISRESISSSVLLLVVLSIGFGLLTESIGLGVLFCVLYPILGYFSWSIYVDVKELFLRASEDIIYQSESHFSHRKTDNRLMGYLLLPINCLMILYFLIMVLYIQFIKITKRS